MVFNQHNFLLPLSRSSLYRLGVKMNLIWDSEVINRLPSLVFCLGEINGVQVSASNEQFDALEAKVVENVRKEFTLKSVKEHPLVRLYRDFFWQHLQIDPTKIRPAAEALLRRVLAGKQLYRINNVVDAYYLAALRTQLSFSIFDQNVIKPPLRIRYAKTNESFLGIGMDAPIQLKGRELVFEDAQNLLSIHPYRDAERSKITSKTKKVLIITGGIPGLEVAYSRQGLQICMKYILQLAGGTQGNLYIKRGSNTLN